jgi:UDP-N-acetylglucosamine diphosphorylase / glucose-1-phosphate thymidylyltransferase / UDP-N-acetylgalactosamine diphosphorylase / glucosamine-1-phosphate N-acetyltransferase / galactosamine-1-phosphate N-acetyltransferase
MTLLGAEALFDLSGYRHRGLFREDGAPWQALDQLAGYLRGLPELGQIEGRVHPGAWLIHPELIHIGAGTVVEAGAYICGPCWIGKDCQVRHGAYLRGDLVTGDRCVIGHATEVKGSIFLDGAQAAHFAYVGDSILGNRVNLGAGTKLANLRFDHGEVSIQHEGHQLATGRRKLGALIGDGAQLGCNCVAAPGTILGREVWVYPNVTCRGLVPAGARVAGNRRVRA